MMNITLLLHTIRHLRPKQLFYQCWYKVYKPDYRIVEAPQCRVPHLQTNPIPRYKSLEGNIFTFLNLPHEFSGWSFTDNGMLWAYNQNYFDFINQDGITKQEGCEWIDRFITELPENRVGLDPYPTALRGINWIKFFCRYPNCATKPRLDSLYSQYKLLEKKLEFHLLGNHLLEDAFSLYIGAAFFQDAKLQKKATKLLLAQLEEQTLSDGAHYEQSPMYHCILLDRLLDCISIASTEELKAFAKKQIGWLKSICYQNGTYPLFNDAANSIAPVPSAIIEYARELGIENQATPLGVSGYRKLSNDKMETFVDIGNITATYQPGHSHADTFNYELRIKGEPFIIDTGISTYDKTTRRQYERSTAAHNTVCVEGEDSSEVWDGFRVGNRPKVRVVKDNYNQITTLHNGFGKTIHTRQFVLKDNEFTVCDSLSSSLLGVSYIHFASNVQILDYSKDRIVTSKGTIVIESARNVVVKKEKTSSEYNCFDDIEVAEISFENTLAYSIRCY